MVYVSKARQIQSWCELCSLDGLYLRCYAHLVNGRGRQVNSAGCCCSRTWREGFGRLHSPLLRQERMLLTCLLLLAICNPSDWSRGFFNGSEPVQGLRPAMMCAGRVWVMLAVYKLWYAYRRRSDTSSKVPKAYLASQTLPKLKPRVVFWKSWRPVYHWWLSR